MTDRRRIEYRADMDTAGFESGSSTLVGRLKTMGKSLQEDGIVGLGQLSQTLGVSGRDVVDFGKRMVAGAFDAVTMGEKIVTVANSFTEVFGPAATGFMTDLKDTRRSMGLTRSEFESMTLPIGQMATNAGFAGDEAAGLAGKLVTLAGDVAAFNPLIGSSEEALVAMQAALRGEFDPLERFGSKLSQSRVNAEKARLLGVDPLNASLSDQQLQIKAVVSLLEHDFAPALGTLQEQQGSAADKAAVLESAFGDLKEEAYKVASAIGSSPAAGVAGALAVTADTLVETEGGFARATQTGSGFSLFKGLLQTIGVVSRDTGKDVTSVAEDAEDAAGRIKAATGGDAAELEALYLRQAAALDILTGKQNEYRDAVARGQSPMAELNRQYRDMAWVLDVLMGRRIDWGAILPPAGVGYKDGQYTPPSSQTSNQVSTWNQINGNRGI